MPKQTQGSQPLRTSSVLTRTLSSLQTANLLKVADPFEENGRKVAAEFNTEWTPEWTDLVRDPASDGIVIASPTPFHAEQIIACAENGKHIFCDSRPPGKLRCTSLAIDPKSGTTALRAQPIGAFSRKDRDVS